MTPPERRAAPDAFETGGRVALCDDDVALGGATASASTSAAQVFVILRVEVPQALEPGTEVVGEAVGPVLVDLHEIAGGVANVELHDVARKLDQSIAEGLVIEGVPALGGAVDRLQVVDGDAEVVMTGRLEVALEEVQLGPPQGEPLDRDAEVRRRDQLRRQQVDVELGRLPEVERVDADVVDARAHRPLPQDLHAVMRRRIARCAQTDEPSTARALAAARRGGCGLSSGVPVDQVEAMPQTRATLRAQ